MTEKEVHKAFKAAAGKTWFEPKRIQYGDGAAVLLWSTAFRLLKIFITPYGECTADREKQGRDHVVYCPRRPLGTRGASPADLWAWLMEST